MKNSKIIFAFSAIFIILFAVFLSRLTSPKELDDFSPEIPCSKEIIEKAKILWVIPKFNNISIDQNPDFCNYLLSLNKTIGMHGVYHTYNEFKTARSQSYLKEGISVFENCFGFSPKIFKPPQLEISYENRALIEQNNLKLKLYTNEIFHKVYHCSDTGILSNEFIDWF